MPEGAVYVGRPSRFGNPYPVECFGSIERVMTMYRRFLTETPIGRDVAVAAQQHLRGKDLACWCPLDQPCHADVLLEIANAL